MGLFLRQDKKKKGIYLQMYECYWDKSIKQARTKCVESFGYVDELKSDSMPDPVSYYKAYVQEQERKRRERLDEKTRPRAFNESIEKNVGYFLLASLIDLLDVKETIDLLASVRQYQFSVYGACQPRCLVSLRTRCP